MRCAHLAFALSLGVALSATTHAQTSDDERARVLFEDGVRRTNEGALDEAVTCFEQSFALRPRASSAFNLAVLLADLGRAEEARAFLENAEALDPSPEMHARAEALRARLDTAASALVVEAEDARALRPERVAHVELEAPSITPMSLDAPQADDARPRRRRRIALATTGAVAIVGAVVAIVLLVPRPSPPYAGTIP